MKWKLVVNINLVFDVTHNEIQKSKIETAKYVLIALIILLDLIEKWMIKKRGQIATVHIM